MTNFKTGDNVIVNDKASFYAGYAAVVVEVVQIESLTICRVEVGNVSFAVRSHLLSAA